jgi:cytoskeletal protein RodZ
LPGGIFSRAFVRAYAVEVGLDPDKTIQHFIASFPNEVTVAAQAAAGRLEDNQAIESERRTAATFLRLVLVSVPAAALVFYFATVGRRASAPPQTSPIAAREPVGAPPATTTPTTNGDRPADPPAPHAPSSAPVATAANIGDPAVGDRLLVGLTVKRAVWVSATVDGQKTIERLFQAGEQRTVEVRRELVLTAGDASAVALTLNGADARPLGKTGEVVTARLDLANFRDYLSSR